jgi:TatA/E family protein of Tat protein translocase
MPFNIGPGELILILAIALLLIGPGKLPEVAQALGKSVREFRKAATDISDAGRLDTNAGLTTGQQAPPTAGPAPTSPVAPAPAAPAPAAASTTEADRDSSSS